MSDEEVVKAAEKIVKDYADEVPHADVRSMPILFKRGPDGSILISVSVLVSNVTNVCEEHALLYSLEVEVSRVLAELAEQGDITTCVEDENPD